MGKYLCWEQGLSEDIRAQTSALLSNLRYIQSYLCRFAPPFQLLEVKAHSFPETLDHLHTIVLEGIQQVAMPFPLGVCCNILSLLSNQKAFKELK